MSGLDWIAVAFLGGIGAVGRFLVDTAASRAYGGEFPLGTFVVNVSGSLVLGLLTGLDLTRTELLFAGTATLGSFTTFSTWALETQRLAEDGELEVASLNLLLTLVAGLAAVTAGWLLGRVL